MSVIPNTYRLPSIHTLDLDLPIVQRNTNENVNNFYPSNKGSLPHLSEVVGTIPQVHIGSISHGPSKYSTNPMLSNQQHYNGFVTPISSPPSTNDGLVALCAAATSRQVHLDPAYYVAPPNNSVQRYFPQIPVSPSVKSDEDNHTLDTPSQTSIQSQNVKNEYSLSNIISPTQSSSHNDNLSSSDETPQIHTASTTQLNKVWKPRKKRQCPECHLFFSNLATHKSTHLKPTSRPHVCEFCQRGFARPNDLFRHMKRHWKETGSDKGQFKCPFKMADSSEDRCCHPSGIFSRCDTYKNHLKAIHFQYPAGTKKDQRNKVQGTCRACHKTFTNVDEWMTSHVEKNMCAYAKEFKIN